MSLTDKCFGVQPTQGKLEGCKKMQNLETNKDYFNFLRLVSFPLKRDHSNNKRRANLLVEMKTKVYCGLKTMAKKFRKYAQVKSIGVHLQNTPTYYVKYRNEEDKVKELIGLKHKGVARVVATEQENVNMSNSVMMENAKMASLHLQGQKELYERQNIYI